MEIGNFCASSVSSSILGQISYDEIVIMVCDNVDERIKFLSVVIPILWMAGNWIENKCYDNKLIDKHFSDIKMPIVSFNFKKMWFEAELMSFKDIVLEFIVPIFRIMLLFAMGFLIYYVYSSGSGGGLL